MKTFVKIRMMIHDLLHFFCENNNVTDRQFLQKRLNKDETRINSSYDKVGIFRKRLSFY
jgi:hypothetical protein